jgi:hypothetical protein
VILRPLMPPKEPRTSVYIAWRGGWAVIPFFQALEFLADIPNASWTAQTLTAFEAVRAWCETARPVDRSSKGWLS